MQRRGLAGAGAAEEPGARADAGVHAPGPVSDNARIIHSGTLP